MNANSFCVSILGCGADSVERLGCRPAVLNLGQFQVEKLPFNVSFNVEVKWK